MSGSLQNKLLSYEVAPPGAVWSSIAKRLDEEYSPEDAAISNRINDLSAPPPVGAWQNIARQLDHETTTPAKGKILPLVIRRTAIAAAIAVLLIAGSIYFFNSAIPSESSTPAQEEVANIPQQPDRAAPAPDTSNSTPADTPKNKSLTPSSPQLADAGVQRSNTRRRATARVAEDDAENQPPRYSYADNEVNFEASQSFPQPVTASQNFSVSAPPIRDGNGEIIMDLDVIRQPGQQYITVTSPNGNPTRISNKFINCLRYLNGSLGASDSHPDAAECRDKFNEWRDRLLSQGEYIPSGDNFFDIFELKELLQE